MSAFHAHEVQADYHAIFYGDRKVAILTPALPAQSWLGIPMFPAEPWTIIPDPEAFPDASCTGLPRPLSPTGNTFPTLGAALSFLGIEQRAEAA
ncbi:hypothetical protein [Methylobacterium fujisawaense]|uniref:hypothetical protein n=1 Tax=Methylobacterium fujisawaense TaxID=107400 RepID=UPI00313C8D6D